MTWRGGVAALFILVWTACSVDDPSVASDASASTGTGGSAGAFGGGGAAGTDSSVAGGAAGDDASAGGSAGLGGGSSQSGGAAGVDSGSGGAGSGGVDSGSGGAGTGGLDGGAGTGAVQQVGHACALCPTTNVAYTGLCYPAAGDPAMACGGKAPKPNNACPIVNHRMPACSGFSCATGTACEPGWADCDGNPANGCEANLFSTTTCGSCGNACASGTVCRAGVCVAACAGNELQCGTSCTGSIRHCGSCGKTCATPQHGSPTCNAGSCGVACDSGFTACGLDCVDTTTNPLHCGGCNKKCSSAGGGAVRCEAGACVTTCHPGLTLCNGRCVDVKTDLDHCGGCNVKCAIGLCAAGACNASLPRVLTTGASVGSLAVDATVVFYFDGAASEIRSVPKNGGAPSTIAAAQANVTDVRLDGSHVYWKNGSGVRRVSKSGGTVELVAATPSQSSALAVDNTHAFWFESPTGPPNGSIRRALKDGSAAPGLVETAVSAGDLEVGSASVYWADGLFQAHRAAKDGTGAGVALSPPLFPAVIETTAFDGAAVYFLGQEGDLLRVDPTFTTFSVVARLSGFALTTLEVGKRAAFLFDDPIWPRAVRVDTCSGAVDPPLGTSLELGTKVALDADHYYTVVGSELRRRPQ